MARYSARVAERASSQTWATAIARRHGGSGAPVGTHHVFFAHKLEEIGGA